MQKIKAVLFDFGGVLATEGFRDGLHELGRRQRLNPASISENGRRIVHQSGYVVGQGTESEFWRRMREETGLRGSDRELSATILSAFVLRPRMVEFVRLLRAKGLITAIVSDQTDWLERLDERDGFFRDFHGVFNSFRLGKSKKDASLFDDVARELAISPAEALFTDDTAEHVKRAESRGMQGIVFEEEDGFLRQATAILKL